MVFESADRGRRTRARSARSRRRCRRTGSRSSRSSTSPTPPSTSTGCRTRSCARSTASASARCRALGEVEVLSGNVKLAMSHVVPDLVQKIVKGQDPLHILGDGNQVRHYTYGGDLARGHRRPRWSTPPRSTTTSTSRPRESTTVLELAENDLATDQRRDVPFRYVSDDRSSTTCRSGVPAVEKARDVLGFEATTTLDEMLDEVVPWILDAMEQGLISSPMATCRTPAPGRRRDRRRPGRHRRHPRSDDGEAQRRAGRSGSSGPARSWLAVGRGGGPPAAGRGGAPGDHGPAARGAARVPPDPDRDKRTRSTSRPTASTCCTRSCRSSGRRSRPLRIPAVPGPGHDPHEPGGERRRVDAGHRLALLPPPAAG